MAQDVSVRSDHPDRYIVVKGDTLWDIAGRFLDKPWQWPAIWHVNPQVANPHLIYPGDELSLVYIDGVPQLRLSREDTVKLSPQVRVVSRQDPINAIPLDSLEPFLREVRVLSPSEFEGLPYVLANEEKRITATYSDQTYARGLKGNVGDEFTVMRLYSIYDRVEEGAEVRRVLPKEHWKQVPNVKDRNETMWNDTLPWQRRPQNPVAYELIEVSRVRMAQSGEISVLDIIRDRTEVREGDYILPVDSRGYDATFYPHAMDSVPEGMRVLATKDSLYGVGHFQIVALSAGSRQGVESGHVFSVFRPGATVDDRTGYRYGSFAEESRVALPDRFHGMVMVFRTFDDISYAMVMSGDHPIREFDKLKHPDERT
ncbi:LysM peptidoglycan-binding domain-containing protein [Elongatibacter sediminis]|uniref:LysM peptidoglycan-binding domain-containing protein n=1 Tax=Elongatibacter sediminis TaxID=3119006 RepID=A0AAW9RMM5_9GAMM